MTIQSLNEDVIIRADGVDSKVVIFENNDNMGSAMSSKKMSNTNLIINGNKVINQRVSGSGGLKQVIEANMNVGSFHTLSFTGTATATVYEFPALLADYATTIADAGTNNLGSGLATNATVNTTSGYFIAIEFSSTDFDNVQFEQGNVATNFEVRHNETDLCLRFYECKDNIYIRIAASTTTIRVSVSYERKRAVPTITLSGSGLANVTTSMIELGSFSVEDTTALIDLLITYKADAEIFNTSATYKEDRWFL